MRPSRRPIALLLLCGTLPVMTTASLAPILPGLHAAFQNVPQIDVLSRLVLTTPALAIAMGAGFAGYLLDRLGRRGVLAVSLLLFAVFGSHGLWVQDIHALIVSRFIFGFAVAGIMTATATLLADFSASHQLRSMMGLQAAIMGGWGIIAQTASGWLAETSWRFPFALFLASLPMIPLVLMWLQDARPPACLDPKRQLGQLLIPYRVWLIGFFSFAAMSLFVIVPIQTPFYFGHQLGIGPTSTALLVSVLTGASSLTSLGFAFFNRRFSQKFILCLGFLCMALGFVILSFWARRLALAGSMVAIGCGIGCIVPCISAWIAELIAPAYRGRAMGLLTTVNYLGQFLTPLWSQLLLQPYGYEGLFLAAALISSVCFLTVIMSLRRLRLNEIENALEIAVHPVPNGSEKAEQSRLSS